MKLRKHGLSKRNGNSSRKGNVKPPNTRSYEKVGPKKRKSLEKKSKILKPKRRILLIMLTIKSKRDLAHGMEIHAKIY